MSDHSWEKDTSIAKERGEEEPEVDGAQSIVDSAMAGMPGAGLGDPGYAGNPEEDAEERIESGSNESGSQESERFEG